MKESSADCIVFQNLNSKKYIFVIKKTLNQQLLVGLYASCMSRFVKGVYMLILQRFTSECNPSLSSPSRPVVSEKWL